MRRRGTALGLLWLVASFALASAHGPAAAQETHALIVVGLGGEERYRERFHEWASTLQDALVERHGLAPERVVYLGERPERDPARIRGPSRRENVEAEVREMARRAGPEDRVLVVLFGHGATREDEAVLNMPGPSMTGSDFARVLAELPTQHVAVVNTASASAPFVQALAGPRRTVITATRSGLQRNETWFGGYFAEAFAGEEADLDKDGTISLFEAFEYARREVERHYQERNLLQTENALLAEGGDTQGSGAPDAAAGDARLARAFTVGRAAAAAALQDESDPVIRGLLEARAELQGRLEALQARRGEMDPAAYDRELEGLLVDIALKDREIRERRGGGS
jgi:hypothetical protein